MSNKDVFRQRFESLEEMAACVRHWDIEFEPLAADCGGTELTQITLEPLLLSHLDTNCPHVHRGASPPGAKTFALLADGNQTVHWCRRQIDEQRLPYFDAAQEFEATAHPRFRIYTLTLSADRLDGSPAWQSSWNHSRRFDPLHRRLFQANKRKVSELRNLIAATLRLCQEDKLSSDRREISNGLGEEIINRLLSAISTGILHQRGSVPTRVARRYNGL